MYKFILSLPGRPLINFDLRENLKHIPDLNISNIGPTGLRRKGINCFIISFDQSDLAVGYRPKTLPVS
jgi:hypothetical protein